MKIGVMRRSNEEYMLLILSFGGAIAIFPFCVTRLLQEEWLVGMVDLTMVVGMIALGALVYFTHNIKGVWTCYHSNRVLLIQAQA